MTGSGALSPGAPADPGAPVVRLENLSKSFERGGVVTEVLRGVTLDIASGDFVALQGASGSGKSTLLYLIGLLDRPTSGHYLLDGKAVEHMSDDELSELRNAAIGFIFQSFYLAPYATALENVMLPGQYGSDSQRNIRKRAEELLALVGLADRMRFKPSQLSGGQQQRVALARALLNRPRLILADEPTGQLDSATSNEIMTLLSNIHAEGQGRTTIILVTHDADTAAFAKRRIFLRDGRVEGQYEIRNENGSPGRTGAGA